MRTKTIYFFSLFLAITMMTGCFHISSGPKPSKSKMTKKYSVTPFNKIENKAPANIVFTQGKDMIVSDVVVEQNGVGSVSCYASGTINISAQGVGSVNYYGDPQVTGLKKSGIGSVKSK